MRPALIALALAAALSCGHAHALTIACGKVFDSESAKLLGPHVIEVVDGRIAALKPGAPAPGSEFIDHGSQTCLPGLIDLHTLISYAGATTIEHGSYMEADLHPLMKQHGTWLVPTLLAGDWVGAKSDQFPPMVAAKARAIRPLLSANFKRAYEGGVRIAFGTDSGVSPHGLNAREFKLMVDAGMPANVGIQTATRNAAEVLGMSADIGSLAPGHFADMVVVDGDPLADVTALEKPAMTYKGGVAYAPMATGK